MFPNHGFKDVRDSVSLKFVSFFFYLLEIYERFNGTINKPLGISNYLFDYGSALIRVHLNRNFLSLSFLICVQYLLYTGLFPSLDVDIDINNLGMYSVRELVLDRCIFTQAMGAVVFLL